MGLGSFELALISHKFADGPFLCPAGDLANINLMKRVALDFRLSLCTLGLAGVPGVLLGRAEGKTPSRAEGEWSGGCPGAGTAVSPQSRHPWDQWMSLSPPLNQGQPFPPSLAARGFTEQRFCIHGQIQGEQGWQRFHFPSTADSGLSSGVSPWS